MQEWRPVHGEAGCLPWDMTDAGGDYARFEVTLPEAKLAIARIITLDGAGATLTTEVNPTDGEDKSIEWAEHVTIGDPFMDGT